MKLLGILLIIAAGLGAGLTYAHRLRWRVDELCRIERLLDVLCDRLIYSAQPLAAVWRSLAEDAAVSACPLVGDTVAQLCKGENIYTAFSHAVEKSVAFGRLTPTEAALLTELGGSLGHSGLEQQAQLIRRCAERLKGHRQEAQGLAAARGRLCPMLGFAGGVCLALLLL